MELWHATAARFDRFDFDRSSLGVHFGTKQAARERARNVGVGKWYLCPYEVDVGNALRLFDEGFDLWNLASQLNDRNILSDRAYDQLAKLSERERLTLLREAIEKAGYQSIVYENEVEDQGSDSFIIWSTDQIEGKPCRRFITAGAKR